MQGEPTATQAEPAATQIIPAQIPGVEFPIKRRSVGHYHIKPLKELINIPNKWETYELGILIEFENYIKGSGERYWIGEIFLANRLFYAK